MSKKPGVMIYFDMLPLLERLSDEHAGILFRAILQYGKTQCVPDLQEPLYLLWPLIQMRLNTDDQRYHQVSQKRKYAIYVRWARHHGQEPLSYNEWLCHIDRNEEEDALPL